MDLAQLFVCVFAYFLAFFAVNTQSLAYFVFCYRFVHYLVVCFCQIDRICIFLFFCRFLPVQRARFKESIVVLICFFLSSGFLMIILLDIVIRFVVLPIVLMFFFTHFGRLFCLFFCTRLHQVQMLVLPFWGSGACTCGIPFLT